jgi:hypothetical protein
MKAEADYFLSKAFKISIRMTRVAYKSFAWDLKSGMVGGVLVARNQGLRSHFSNNYYLIRQASKL